MTRSSATGAFANATGAAVRPYSDARLLWDEQHLYLALYAADEDIRFGGSDVFHLVFSLSGRQYSVDIDPQGLTSHAQITGGSARSPWEPELRIGHDVDGTHDDARDDDEEWVLELAMPWSALGVQPRPNTQFGLEITRCDVPHHADQVCGSWGAGSTGTVVLE